MDRAYGEALRTHGQGRVERLLPVLLFCGALLPLFLLPFLPLTLGDIATVAPAAVVVALCLVAGAHLLRARQLQVEHVRPLLFLYAAPAVALVATLWSFSRHASLLGFNGETGSVLALCAAAAFAYVGFEILRGARALRFLLALALASLVVGAGAVVLVLVRGSFNEATALPFGMSEAFFASLAAVLFAMLGATAPRRLMRAVFWVLASVALLCGAFAYVHAAFANPSALQALELQGGELFHGPLRALLGAGPNTYAYVWNRYGPPTQDGLTFGNGVGLYDTLLATEGLIGVLPLLLFVLAFAASARTVWRDGSIAGRAAYAAATWGWLSFLFWYPDSIALAEVALLSGVALARAGGVRALHFSAQRARLFGWVLLCLFAGGTVVLFLQERAVVNYQQSLSELLDSSDLGQSQLYAAAAIRLLPQAVYYRALAEVQERQILLLLTAPQDPKAPKDPQTLAAEVGAFAKGSIGNAQSAVDSDPNNYLNWVVLGDAYAQLAMLHAVGAPEQAKIDYEKAHALAPNNPAPLMLEAALMKTIGQPGPAQTLTYEAQQLSPQFVLPQSFEAARGEASR